MNRTFCDACQSEILDPSQAVTVHARRGTNAGTDHYDLCPNCWDSIDAYIRNPELAIFNP